MNTFQADDFIYISRIIYQAQSDNPKWGESEIDYILFIKTNKLTNTKINYVKNEVADIKWVNQQQLKDLIHNRKQLNITISPWFHMIMDQFGYQWWNQIDDIITNKGLTNENETNTIHQLDTNKHIVS